MRWKIEYYSEKTRAEIDSLPVGIRVSYARLTGLLEEFGLFFQLPHSRPMGGGLFELRPKGREGIARVFYCAMVGGKIVILHSFVKKTGKTPKRELELAIARLKEVRKYG